MLDRLSELVEDARAVPMSSSCVVNRGELLTLLDDARELLPEDLVRARRLLADQEALLERSRQEGERIVGQAQQEQSRLVEASAVFQRAQAEADRMLEQARADADGMRRETEDYVDSKLAGFEALLAKTLSAVERGRAKLDASAGRPEPPPGRPDDART